MYIFCSMSAFEYLPDFASVIIYISVCYYIIAVNCPYNRDHLPDKALLYYGPYAAAKYFNTAHRKVIPYREGYIIEYMCMCRVCVGVCVRGCVCGCALGEAKFENS